MRSSAPGRLLVVASLVALALAGSSLGETPVVTRQVQTVEGASPGTVFGELVRDDGRTRITVGLIKRGRSGEFLFNPSTDAVVLDRGDLLVDRDGRPYAVTAPQRIGGGSGTVGPGGRIYPGEGGTQFVGFESTSLVGVPSQGAGGSVLDLSPSVPEDQETGLYQDPVDTALTVSVREARVGDVRLFNTNGREIAPGTAVQPVGFVVVSADVNFLDAERARIAVVDPTTGGAITAGVLSREEAMARFPESAGVIARLVPFGKASPEGPDGTVRSLVNPANQPSTTIYLVQDLGAIRKAGTYRVEVGGDTGGPFGDLYRAGVRRSVNLTLDAGGTSGPPGEPVEPPTIDSPNGTYTAGETVDVSGRADPAAGAVALYVRAGDGWELLSTDLGNVSVGEDGRWAVGAVDLSAVDGRLAEPGTHELGVIALADADTDGDGTVDETLSAERFASGASTARPLVVVAPPTGTVTTTEGTPTSGGPTATQTATATPSPTPRERPTGTPTPPSPTGGAGPGFGVGAGLVGVVAALTALVALVAARRGRSW